MRQQATEGKMRSEHSAASTVQSALSIREPDRLLLYCPYDRKVTRHARRAPGNEFTCLECGRRLDTGEPAQGIGDMGRGTEAAGAESPPPSGGRGAPTRRGWGPGAWGAATVNVAAFRGEGGRRVRVRPQRLRGVWLPLALVSVVVLVGLLGAIHVAGNLVATSSPPSEAGGQPSAESVEIGNTEGVGAYIRRTPNLDDWLRAWPDGTPLKVIGADFSADGILWKQVEDPAGNQGWIPAQYTNK